MEQLKKAHGRSKHAAAAILLLIACLTACRSDKADTGWMDQSFSFENGFPAGTQDSAACILRQSTSRNVDFHTFASNMNAKLKLGALRIGMGGQIRIAADSVIWAIVHKMGLELVRLKFTPDSLFMYSKASQTAAIYTAPSDSSMMPVLYKICQNLLMHRTDTLIFNGEKTVSRTKKGFWQIRGLSEDSVAWATLLDDRTYRILQFDIAVREGNSEMQVTFRYPKEHVMDIRLAQNRKELIRVEIEYTQPQADIPLSFPFQIPETVPVMHNQGLVKSMKAVENEHILPE